MPKKDIEQRKERLYGAMAGLSATPISDLLTDTVDILMARGYKSFEPGEKIPKELETLAKELSRVLKIEKPILKPSVSRGSYFDLSTGDINLHRPSPAELAHELGHAKPSFVRSLAYPIMRNPYVRFGALGSGIGAALSENETLQAVSPLIAAAPEIPVLMEELRASAHGAKGLLATRGIGEASEVLTRMGPAFLAYLLPALATAAAPLIAKAVWQYAKGQKKEAGIAPFKVTGRLKIPAPSKWTKNPRVKQPKTSKPSKQVKTTPKENPPSKEKYYSDMLKRLQDQRYGTRGLL